MDCIVAPPPPQEPSVYSDNYVEPLSDHSAYPRLSPDRYNADDYTFCRWATCVSGWDVNAQANVLIAVTCKRWGCPYCANAKVRRLAWMCKNALPTRLVTVTISSHRYPDGKSGWDGMSKAFPELIRFLRKGGATHHKQTAQEIAAKAPRIPIPSEVEYLRVLELQANGTPHFHCLLRSPFLLHADALTEWRRLIGEPDPAIGRIDEITYDNARWRTPDGAPKAWAGINIKAIDKSFATFRYLVKYLTKLHKLPWTDRHVSYSRDFFRPEDKEQVEYAKLDNIAKYDQHPWVWLRERLAWETVTVLADGKWVLPAEIPPRFQTIDPAALGLPATAPEQPPLPLKQRLVPGLEAPDNPDADDHLRPDGSRRAKPARRNPARVDQYQPAADPLPAPDDDF